MAYSLIYIRYIVKYLWYILRFNKYWFKHILLARTVDIIKQMLTVLKLQGLELKQHAYIIPFLITNNIL